MNISESTGAAISAPNTTTATDPSAGWELRWGPGGTISSALMTPAGLEPFLNAALCELSQWITGTLDANPALVAEVGEWLDGAGERYRECAGRYSMLCVLLCTVKERKQAFHETVGPDGRRRLRIPIRVGEEAQACLRALEELPTDDCSPCTFLVGAREERPEDDHPGARRFISFWTGERELNMFSFAQVADAEAAVERLNGAWRFGVTNVSLGPADGGSVVTFISDEDIPQHLVFGGVACELRPCDQYLLFRRFWDVTLLFGDDHIPIGPEDAAAGQCFMRNLRAERKPRRELTD